MKDPATMTNAQIVKEYLGIQTRQSEVAQQMIEDGFGHLRPSDMRANPDVHPLARETLASFDRARSLGNEADLRYGPHLIVIEHLVTAQGKSYRRLSA